MNSALALLRREHQRLLELADATDQLVGKIGAKQPVAPAGPGAVTELFSLFAHLIHRDKEELLLFPLLRSKGFREGSCIGVLFSEHEECNVVYANMEQAATDYAGGDTTAAARWANAAHTYCDRLRYHVRREELLFANAEQMLSDSENAELISQFMRLDEKARRAGLQERIEEAQQRLSEALKT